MPIIDSGYVSLLERRSSNPAEGSNANAVQGGAAGTSIKERKASFAEVAALINSENTNNTTAPATAKQSSAGPSFKFWEKEDMSFGDLVDIINPLQHIPIVSTIYRNLTGDQIGAAPRVIGGALWGRAGGLIAGIVNTAVEWFTGKDIGDHIYAMLFGAPKAAASAIAVAQSKTSTALSGKNSAPALSAGEPSAPSIPEPQVAPPAAIQERALIESTLRTSDPRNDSAVSVTNETKDVPVVNVTPWPAASALHIFQKHDRHLGLKEDSIAPILRYVA